MKAIDVEVSPFAFRSSWRWLTPAALVALLGVVALATDHGNRTRADGPQNRHFSAPLI